MLALPCGRSSIRFRLPFIVTAAEVDEMLARLGACVSRRSRAIMRPIATPLQQLSE
jgi:hypothetical protein